MRYDCEKGARAVSGTERQCYLRPRNKSDKHWRSRGKKFRRVTRVYIYVCTTESRMYVGTDTFLFIRAVFVDTRLSALAFTKRRAFASPGVFFLRADRLKSRRKHACIRYLECEFSDRCPIDRSRIRLN